MLEDFNLLEIFWDYDIIVTIDMPSLGYYPALGLYSAGKSTCIGPVKWFLHADVSVPLTNHKTILTGIVLTIPGKI